MQSEKEKYLALEKTEHENLSMLPIVKKKAIELSRKILGTKNFSGIITYLINKEYNEIFEDK